MALRAHSRRFVEPSALSRFFRSFRRTLACILLPDEIPKPSDLAAIVPNPRGDGLWTLDRRGNVFAFGSVPEFREVPEPVPWREGTFVSLVSTPSGLGLWALDSNGNVFAFGDAPEFREVPEPVPWREGKFVAFASTPSGLGLWVLERNGNILCFGDATEFQPSRKKE